MERTERARVVANKKKARFVALAEASAAKRRRVVEPVACAVDVADVETSSSSSEGEVSSSDFSLSSSEYSSSDNERADIEFPNKYVVCRTCDIYDLIEQVNATSACTQTEGCEGKLVPSRVRTVGLGGGCQLSFSCNGCNSRRICTEAALASSSSRRYLTSLAVQVSSIIGGVGFAGYTRIFSQCMGMSTVGPKPFADVVKVLYPHVVELVDEQISMALDEMCKLQDEDLGSLKNAVTTSDGCWLTRGSFSKNGTVTVRNFCNNSLLARKHMCQERGASEIIDESVYKGTSKSMEGYGTQACLEDLAAAGVFITCHWQDGDSSSEKSFRSVYPDEGKSRIMFCGGHVGRAHRKQLMVLSKLKKFTQQYGTRHNLTMHDKALACHCKNRHGRNCGCLSATFIGRAVLNHAAALVQSGTDHESYATAMRDLGMHHARDIHEWGDSGQCCFHPLMKCSCGECDGDDLRCPGKPYRTRNALTCEFHAKAYEIECLQRARKSHQVIHPVLGRGHSNLPESSHHLMTMFRSKDRSLKRQYYCLTTDLGLLQANLSFMTGGLDDSYHWILELFANMKLPILDGMKEGCLKANKERQRHLKHKSLLPTKQRRFALKIARAEVQEARKAWVRNHANAHTYGESSGSDEAE